MRTRSETALSGALSETALGLSEVVFSGSQLEGSLDLTPRMNQRPQVGALEPHAATEEQATGARLVCLSAGLVKVS